MTRVVVAYEHEPSDLGAVELAVVTGRPGESDWVPALRDTFDGQRVVWIRGEVPRFGARVWLRDREGHRRVRAL